METLAMRIDSTYPNLMAETTLFLQKFSTLEEALLSRKGLTAWSDSGCG